MGIIRRKGKNIEWVTYTIDKKRKMKWKETRWKRRNEERKSGPNHLRLIWKGKSSERNGVALWSAKAKWKKRIVTPAMQHFIQKWRRKGKGEQKSPLMQKGFWWWERKMRWKVIDPIIIHPHSRHMNDFSKLVANSSGGEEEWMARDVDNAASEKRWMNSWVCDQDLCHCYQSRSRRFRRYS